MTGRNLSFDSSPRRFTRRAAPHTALQVALSVWLSASLGLHTTAPVGPLVLLLLLGIARGGRGVAVIGFALGTLAAVTTLPGGPERAPTLHVDSSHSDGIRGAFRVEVESPWERSDFGWRSEVRVVAARYRNHVSVAQLRATLSLPGEGEPPASSCLRLKGRLRPVGTYYNGGRDRAVQLALTTPSRRLLEACAGAAEGSSPRLLRASRNRFIERLAGDSCGLGCALVFATLLGEKGYLPEESTRTFRRFGFAHLVAVSGLHVGLVALMASGVLRLLRLPLPVRNVFLVAVLFAFCTIAGWGAPVVRAGLTATIGLLLLGSGRAFRPLDVLSVAVSALVLADPRRVASLSFQLTVAATFGILVLLPLFSRSPRARSREGQLWGRDTTPSRWWQRPGTWPFQVPWAAQISTAPLTVPVFGVMTPLTFVLEPLASLWLVFALILGSAMVSLSVLSGSALDTFSLVGDMIAWPVETLESLRPSVWWTLVISPVRALMAVVVVLLLIVLRRRSWLLLLVALLSLSGSDPAGVIESNGQSEPSTTLVMLDVGQGDSILLRRGNTSLLVDGGGFRRGDFAASVLVPALSRLNVARLDAVLVSHGDSDHCEGVRDLIDWVPVGELWVAQKAVRAAEDQAAGGCVAKLAAEFGATATRQLAAGDRFRFGEWRFDVLSPRRDEGRRSRNRDSLVVRAEVEGHCVLFTGDIDRQGEEALLSRRDAIACDVLKVAHHGSKTSTGVPWLAAVRPKVALVSVGRRNRYRHPAEEVLERLSELPVQVFRTDLNGQVRVNLRRGHPLQVEVTCDLPPSR